MKPIIYEDESGSWDAVDVCNLIKQFKEAEKEIAELKIVAETRAIYHKALSEHHTQQQADIKELAEALNNSSDTLAWFGKHDFALTYKNIANKYLKGE